MTGYRIQPLGPLPPGDGSLAVLGLAVSVDERARPAVLVWVPEEAERDPALLGAIRRETEHAALLDHPNIVAVLALAFVEGRHARVVEYADAEPLRVVLAAAGALPLPIAVRVVADACTGAHYAHLAGNDDGSPFIHGDLRPQTLLVCFGGATKVSGYGALAFAPQRPGGPGVYSAPEQAAGGPRDVSLATDVYLLGLTLAECLTGQAVLAPWLEEAVPPALAAVIRRACAPAPGDRYPTPLALREAIELAVGGVVAGDGEVAAWMEALFPGGSPLRAGRRRLLDAGLAALAQGQPAAPRPAEATPTAPGLPGHRSSPVVAEAPSAPSGIPGPPRPSPARDPAPPPGSPAPARLVVGGRPVEAVRLVEPPPSAPEVEEAPPSDPGSTLPWLAALGLFLAAVAALWSWTKANAPIPGVDIGRGAEATVEAARPAEPPVLTAAPPGASAAAPPGARLEPVAAIAPGSAAARAPVGPRAGASSAAGAAAPDAGPATQLASVQVSLAVTPDVELLVDGRSLGRSPWSGVLPPGRRVLTLRDPALGINATRILVLGTQGAVEDYQLEKGSLALFAPAGARISVDGVGLGVAPLRGEVPLYEGQHAVEVLVGQSVWRDTFVLQPAQRIRFEVKGE